MIDPDINNVNLIPESKLTMLEIENVSKIKDENKFLKRSIIVIMIVVVIVAIRKYYNSRNEDSIVK
jgi:hypothetical protein